MRFAHARAASHDSLLNRCRHPGHGHKRPRDLVGILLDGAPASASELSPCTPLIANGTLWQLSALSVKHPNIEELLMVDRDRVEGSLEQAKGKVKEVVGKVTGDKKTEGEGKADQVKGKIQNTIGGIKDTLKGE